MLGRRMKDKRKSLGYTQKEVADHIGIARTTYAMYESESRDPDTKTLENLADFYGVSTDYLLGRDVPEWASTEDVFELQTLLENNVNMAYGGESLTDAEKQRVKDILTALFWEKLQKKKKDGGVSE